MGSGLSSSELSARVVAHSMAGGITSVLQGGKFGHGFASAGFTAGLNPALANMNTVSATIASALIGGTISAATGGKFANGAVTGAMQMAMGRHQRQLDYQQTGPDISVVPVSTPDHAGPERLQTFYKAMSLADEVGIEFGSGTRVIYIDRYAFLDENHQLIFCDVNCLDVAETLSYVGGHYDGSRRLITLYRGAVEPQMISGTTRHHHLGTNIDPDWIRIGNTGIGS